jgi:hypothetical protein
MESTCHSTRSLSLQVTFYWLCEPYLSPQCRRNVSCGAFSSPVLILVLGGFFRSGSVCLDVINQTWSPMFDLVNIFEVFLPQLLTYPNPSDPLNGEAAALEMREPEKYIAKVKDYVQKYAHPSLFGSSKKETDDVDSDSDIDSEWSDLEDNETSCPEQVGAVAGSSVVKSGIFV